MSASVGVSPWQKRPVSLWPARCPSSAVRVSRVQWRRHSVCCDSRKFNSRSRYRRIRGTSGGWPSQATISARPRTRARPRASFGSSGGVGWVSSRYSMMASDWNSVVPSSSTSAGSAICGLTFRNSSVWCALVSRSTNTTSVGSFFRLSAIRTRKLACDRQKEKNFMGGLPVMPGLDPGIHRFSQESWKKMDHRVKPGDDDGREKLSPHRLLAIRQMDRAGAPGRMRRDVVGGDRRHRRGCGFPGGLVLGGDVVEHWRQPALGLSDAHALARGIILDLVALDLADTEIEALGVAEIKPGDRRARPHRIALGEPDARILLRIEQAEQRRLLGVVGLRGIAG